MSPDEEFCGRFWESRTNMRALADAIQTYMKVKGFSVPDFVREIEANWTSGTQILNPSALRRFAKNVDHKPRNKQAVSVLLQMMCELASREKAVPPEEPGPDFAPLYELLARYESQLAAHLKAPRGQSNTAPSAAQDAAGPSDAEADEQVISEPQRALFFSVLAKMLRINEGQLRRGCGTFFTDDEVGAVTRKPDQSKDKFYDLYRPHGSAGQIVKSFLKISIVGYAFGHAGYFTNYYCQTVVDAGADIPARRDIRTAVGMLIPTKRVLYLIGGISGGNGLKIIAIDDPGTPQYNFNGLLMSLEGTRIPVVSRCVLQVSKASREEDALIGIFPEDALKDELGEHWSYLKKPPGPNATLAMD